MYYLVFNCWLVLLLFLGHDGVGRPWLDIGLSSGRLVPIGTLAPKARGGWTQRVFVTIVLQDVMLATPNAWRDV